MTSKCIECGCPLVWDESELGPVSCSDCLEKDYGPTEFDTTVVDLTQEEEWTPVCQSCTLAPCACRVLDLQSQKYLRQVLADCFIIPPQDTIEVLDSVPQASGYGTELMPYLIE